MLVRSCLRRDSLTEHGAGYLVICVALLLCVSASQANIISISYGSDGDGGLVCPDYTWMGNSPVASLSLSGVQYQATAHAIAEVTVSDALDPSLRFDNSIENRTGFAWTQFRVNLASTVPFALCGVGLSIPSDWSVVGFDSTATYTGSNYLATVVYSTGTPIPSDGVSSIDFGYWVVVSDASSYQLVQEFVAIPEPSAVMLVAMGTALFSLVVSRHRLRYCSCSRRA